LINDLVRLIGPAEAVQVMQSRLFTGRPTVDNAQLGIRFRDGALANIFASFCVRDGDFYRNSMVFNFENGTIYRNTGPQRGTGGQSELALVQADSENRRKLVDQAQVSGGSGEYQWEAFVRAVRSETLAGAVTPEQVADGLRVIRAMGEALRGAGTAPVL
jgi:predicted dehydrogenase